MADEDDDSRINDQASRPDPFQARDDGFFNPARNEPRLPQDYATPASPPSDVKGSYNKDAPQGDTDVDAAEVYDTGDPSA